METKKSLKNEIVVTNHFIMHHFTWQLREEQKGDAHGKAGYSKKIYRMNIILIRVDIGSSN